MKASGFGNIQKSAKAISAVKAIEPNNHQMQKNNNIINRNTKPVHLAIGLIAYIIEMNKRTAVIENRSRVAISLKIRNK